MKISPETLSRVAYRFYLGKIREATKEDEGPFMIVRTRYFDNELQYTGIARRTSDNTILRYDTLEEAQEGIKREFTEVYQYEGKEVFKPTFTIVVCF